MERKGSRPFRRNNNPNNDVLRLAGGERAADESGPVRVAPVIFILHSSPLGVRHTAASRPLGLHDRGAPRKTVCLCVQVSIRLSVCSQFQANRLEASGAKRGAKKMSKKRAKQERSNFFLLSLSSALAPPRRIIKTNIRSNCFAAKLA